MKQFLIVLTLILLIMGGCSLFQKTSYQNVSHLYNPKNILKTPEYLIFHKSDSISSLYFKINTLDLLYLKANNKETYYSDFKLKIEIKETYQSKYVIDSFSKQYCDSNFAFINKDLVYNIDISLKNNDFVIKTIFSDENKHSVSISYINVFKKNKYTSQNYLLVNKESIPLFKNIIPKSQLFRIYCGDNSVKELYVSCYYKDFPIAGPPFSKSKERPYVLKADNNYIVDVTNGYTALLSINKKGIYHFKQDSSINEGISVFHYYDDFPIITSPFQMLLPLRYVSSKKEFNDILMSQDKKIGIETFWLQIAGNTEKAKLMIKKYYNLVQEANVYFSSYQEGWKTDRGIIYIIYGSPDVVYKTDKTETWIYGDESNRLSTRFYFYNVTNRFTDNDYSLSKSETYRDSWYVAMRLWREKI